MGRTERAELSAIRDRLLEAGLSDVGLRARLGLSDSVPLHIPEVAMALRFSNCETAADALGRLLVAGSPTDRATIDRLVGRDLVRTLERAGLVSVGPREVRSLRSMLPYGDLLIAFDQQPPPEDPASYVPGVQDPSHLLAALTMRRRVASALDIGTGCGVQALLAATHSERVTAVDINRRATELTAFNAALNRIENVRVVHGDLFEPVDDGGFDLIVSNPPFLIAPASDYRFRDSPDPDDAFCRKLVEAMPAHLNEGGLAYVVCSWIRAPNEPPDTGVRPWLDDCGCDALLFHHSTHDPLSYATAWNRSIPDELAYEQSVRRWMDYYARRGIEMIAFGLLVLRRRASGPNWMRCFDLPVVHVPPAGDQVLRIIEGLDDIAAVSERELLHRVYGFTGSHRLEQVMSYRGSAYEIPDVTVISDEPLPLAVQIDPRAAHLLFRLSERRPLHELIDGVARDAGLDGEDLAALAVRAIGDLLAAGIIRPVDGPRG